MKSKSNALALIASVIIGLVIFTVTALLITFELRQLKNDEIMSSTNKFLHFHSEIESFITQNTNLIKGFGAYIQTFDVYPDDEVYKLLDNMLKDDLETIRNVGILKDTTIVWNYPYEGNTSSIGADLSKVEGQAESVLKVKNELITVFQGPVNLVQGGIGFIIRSPILKDGSYWGMSSVVLNGDVAFEFIKLAEDLDQMSYLITRNNNSDKILYGDSNILNQDPLFFENDSSLGNWDIYVIPENGWQYDGNTLRVVGIIFSMLLGTYIARKTYMLINRYSSIKEKQTQLENISSKDMFTGIYNRGYFDRRVLEAISQADRHEQELSIIYFDLDKFKTINDNFGHSEGDNVIIAVTESVSSIIRKEDLFARWGGDEFVVLMPLTSLTGAIIAAEKIRETIENIEFKLPICVTTSIGVSERVAHEFWDSWFRRTDKALYDSKQKGRNCLTISEHVDDKKILVKIVWDNEWLSGNSVNDEEHKELVKIANELVESSFSIEDQEEYIIKIEEVFDHTTEHFKSEEQILENVDFPQLEEHKDKHKVLAKAFAELLVDAKNNRITVDSVFDFLFNEVIIGHMVNEDSKFFAYVSNTSVNTELDI